MKNTRYKYKVFRAFEFMIVALVLLTILVTSKEIVWTIFEDMESGELLANYKIILSEILLLAVGVELAILIIKKDIYFVIDILILAIARKMITYEKSADIFVSIGCIVILLAARIMKMRLLPPSPKEAAKQKQQEAETHGEAVLNKEGA
ncbi:hypothetical protein [Cohnella sp. AR92]|uniref:hypothetical protein n=1 Tax=Cohnella sp. AR92 TaxID=648716 RepID=UPI000F8CBE62|nr:hypothetical protein [Cohnella sp. AR92]RUS45572.1 hypothetical protein ELR57_19695 [Cohnella sp. AR92]